MKHRTDRIIIPAILIGIAAVQSFGIDTGRALRIGQKADSLFLSPDSSFLMSEHRDSTQTNPEDSILNIISAADTIVPPDSLRETDPFRYKYYVAIKDSLTRVHTRDSLLSAGDTLELMKLDSLYLKDSADVAALKFRLWYDSLSKKEKKKWKYEQELPAKMARMDSILHRKDSLKAAKDSITEVTPRILETYALPDSLHYKRLVTWEHDRFFHNLEINPQDTSFNYHFNDYPFLKEDIDASHLGVAGSPVQLYNYFKRDEERNAIFYSPYAIYSYTPENLPMFNTKTPYTELAYWGTLFANSEKEESNIKILTTQNILPSLNVTLEYHRFGGNGMLQKENTDNRTFVASANYLGKRYMMHAGYIFNRIKKSENGGLTDNFWIRDTIVDAREIAVYLGNASNVTKKNTVFLDQSYRIPFDFINNIGKRKERKAEKARRDSIMASGDSIAIAELLENEAMKQQAEMTAEQDADTLNTDITTAFIGHSSEYSVFSKFYKDDISSSDKFGSDFYNGKFYINPTSSADSMRVMKLENRVFLRLQPWSSDGIVSKIDVGIGDKLLNYYNADRNSFVVKSSNTVYNSLYLYAGAQGKFRKYLSWDAFGKYTFLGKEINDFGINANISFNAYPFRKDKNSPLTLKAHFETTLSEPDHYQQHFFSNHFIWNNNFGKISSTKVEASLLVPHWKLQASFGYALLNNNIYYDEQGIVRQNSTPMSIMTASLMKNFKLWNFHFDHKAMFQVSSNESVLPLPMLALNLRYYFQFNVVKDVMKMQIGADGRFATKWYAPAYNPVLGTFHNQTEMKYGNSPYIDVFVNIQWKRACVFVKVINVNMGWPNESADYFSAHHYIRSQRAIKFGIFWPFYVQSGKNSSVGGGKGGSTGGGSGSNFGPTPGGSPSGGPTPMGGRPSFGKSLAR